MTSELRANSVAAAGELVIQRAPLPAEQLVEGASEVGYVSLVDDPSLSVGVWEITPGVSTDIEVDEYFIVLSGRGTVEFDGDDSVYELAPGTVGRLAAGAASRWTITETLRKVYLAPAAS